MFSFLMLVSFLSLGNQEEFKMFDKYTYESAKFTDVIDEKYQSINYENNKEYYIYSDYDYLGEYSRIKYNDYEIKDDFIYFAGYSSNSSDSFYERSVDAFLIKYNKDLKIIDYKVLEGNGFDEITSITSVNDYLYLAVNTKSNDRDYKNLNKSINYNNSVIFKLDENYNILQSKNVTKNNESFIKKIKSDANYIYVLLSSGDYRNRKCYFLVLDHYLDIVTEINLPNSTEIYDFLSYDGVFYFVGDTSNEEYGIIRQTAALFTYNGDLTCKIAVTSDISSFYSIENIEETLYLTGSTGLRRKEDNDDNANGIFSIYDGELNIRQIDGIKLINITKTNNGFMLYGSKSYTTKTSYTKKPKIVLLDNDLIIYAEKEFDEINSSFINNFFIDSNLYFINNIEYVDGSGLYLKANVKRLVNINIYYDQFYYNGTLLEPKLKYYEDEYNEEVFGNYYMYDMYDFGILKAYNNYHSKRVELLVNIEDKLYKEDLTLISNGTMFLNKEKISNDYNLTIDGVYDLTIYGSNGEVKNIQFEIKKPTEVNNEEEVLNNIYEDNEEVVLNNTTETVVSENETSEDNILEENTSIKNKNIDETDYTVNDWYNNRNKETLTNYNGGFFASTNQISFWIIYVLIILIIVLYITIRKKLK